VGGECCAAAVRRSAWQHVREQRQQVVVAGAARHGVCSRLAQALVVRLVGRRREWRVLCGGCQVWHLAPCEGAAAVPHGGPCVAYTACKPFGAVEMAYSCVACCRSRYPGRCRTASSVLGRSEERGQHAAQPGLFYPVNYKVGIAFSSRTVQGWWQ
jgi:hypothetical protein